MSGGMLPWTTRNQIINGHMPLIDDVKSDTKNVVTRMLDTVLLHQLCGEDCRLCEIQCNYGAEALRRGLDIYSTTIDAKHMRSRWRVRLDEVEERPKGYYCAQEVADKWGVSESTIEHWIRLSGSKAEYRYRAAPHKVYTLYSEKKLMERSIAFASDGRHEIMRGRLLKIKEAQGL
jgi:transcription elongation factor Elf1